MLELGHKVTALAKTRRFSVPEVLPKEVMQEVEIVQGDMADPEVMLDLVSRSDVIFHTAANQGGAAAPEHAHDFLRTNIGSVSTLVDALRKATRRPRLIVLGSSISVYGEGCYNCRQCGVVRPGLRYRLEDVVHLPDNKGRSANQADWNPCCPRCAGEATPVPTAESAERHGESVYAVAKKAQEDLLASACRLHGISFASLRYGTIIGAGQSWHNPFTRFLDLLTGGDAPTLNEDGCQTRDFIFAQDVVEANVLALQQRQPSIQFLNVASGQPVTLLDFTAQLAGLVSEILGIDTGKTKVDHKFVSGDVRHCFVDCRKSYDELGFETHVKLPDGLKQLVQWYAGRKGSSSGSLQAKAV
jgi:dTDP-L-rhamnose 4-epimerase